MYCPSCGFENIKGLNFCIECRVSLKDLCPACGFKNSSQAKFCGQCGTPLIEKEGEGQKGQGEKGKAKGKRRGDGLLVYFGYPIAHEDDAQRAVRTGLEIVEKLGQLNISLGL